ncbi:MAG: Maf family protein [Armatimonadota bacterium]
MPDFYLASASPQREKLLKKIVCDFHIIPSGFDESTVEKWPPEEHVTKSATGKASDIAIRINDGIIIGSDTVVVLDSEIMGKPVDEADAARMLESLSDRKHHVYTGICAILKVNGLVKQIASDYDKTAVVFRKLSNDDITQYLQTGEYIGRAGAYAIQEQGQYLVDHIEGDFDNVVGLPVAKLKLMLAEIVNDEY